MKFATLLQSVLALAITASSAASHAAAPGTEPERFITLGTGAGPRPDPERAQPANVLLADGRVILVDVGDGATSQLGKAGLTMESVTDVFLSHLHFDHTGGLFALLSRRYQILTPGKVHIYGPPGTKATVGALLAAIQPAAASAGNITGQDNRPAPNLIEVTEIADGWAGSLGAIKVRATSNTHYVLAAATDPTRLDSFAFRFDTPQRSLVYCGDTGPSENIEALAKGADILVCEIMDPDFSLARLKAARPDISAAAYAAISAHFHRQHISPREVGLMANRAGVRTLALTHNAIPRAQLPAARDEISSVFRGKIVFSEDLQIL